MAQYDIWAVNPTSDDDYFRTSATIAASGSIALLANDVGQYGTGYKVSITSDGADANKTFTINVDKILKENARQFDVKLIDGDRIEVPAVGIRF